MNNQTLEREPRPATGLMAARPGVLVASESPARVREVARSLKGLRATVVGVDWEGYVEKLSSGFAAMVIAEPVPVSLAAAAGAVRGHPVGDHLPIYALVDGAASVVDARNAYLAGASAVVEWPREREIFASLLAETMGMTIVRGASTRADVALTRTVRAHLRLGPAPGSSIRLSSKKGTVAVSGEARTLAELGHIVETIAAVPGVKEVLTSGLRVAPSGIPDQTIARSIRAVMRATSEIDEKALPVSVRGGRVKLRGVVPDRTAFHDLLDLVASVKGVRDLDWEVTVSGERSASDRSTARRLRRAIATYHPQEKIDAAVLAGVAVLSGNVRSLPAKRAAERLASRVEGVRRVVNKLVVEGD